jgi:capsular polysaccharide biosynthesis protein
VLNEDKLIHLLESYGFKGVLLSTLPFTKQAELFASAKVIISAHGAGLANLSFCREGTHVIELFSKHYVKPTYQIISKRGKLNYKYITCESGENDKISNMEEANKSHIHVDLPELTQVLNKVKVRYLEGLSA